MLRALLYGSMWMCLGACVQLLGGEREVVGDDLECDDDDDCKDDYGCDDSGMCRRKCFEDAECGAHRSCYYDRFCTDPIGTPCDPDGYTDCKGASCEAVDTANDDVLGYCTVFCSSQEPCPTGYTCVDYSCIVNAD